MSGRAQEGGKGPPFCAFQSRLLSSMTQPPPPFLCGTLALTIHAACDLPNLDESCFVPCECLQDRTDSYIRVMINDRKGPRTATVQNDLNPQWEERLIVELVGEIQSLELQIKDDNMVSAAGFVASVTLPPELYTSSEKVDKIWLPLALSKWPNGKKDKKRDTAKLCISTRYINAADAVGTACPYTPYPQRSGCAVSLFADAHDSPLPDVDIDAGTYMPGDLWNEVYASLCVAQRFIYITGWSVWTGLKLNRLPEGVEHETLGELLKRKADEGVHVCVMVWNDATSYDFGLGRWSKSDGLMGVRDEETKEYFKDSKVVCEAVPCNSQGFRTNVDGTTSYTARLAGKLGKSANFTHHQKTIMCDEEAPRSDRRKVVAYVGGIDLCGGRYDDHTHPLFDTLGGVHKGDFYQCCIPGVDEAYGPREPWHDLHSKVEGPVARDVVHNFETRWKRQVPLLSCGGERNCEGRRTKGWEGNLMIAGQIDSSGGKSCTARVVDKHSVPPPLVACAQVGLLQTSSVNNVSPTLRALLYTRRLVQ